MIMGHRGFGKGVVGGQVENTIGSVRAALDSGADWIEIDVRRTRDDGLVVLHNPTCDSGAFVGDLAADEADGEGLLRLSELLAILPAGVGVNIDVKSSLEDGTRERSATTAALVARVVTANAHRHPIMVTSFDAAALLIVQDTVPNIPVGLLTWVGFPLRKAVPMAAHLGLDAVVAHVSSFGANRIDPAPVHRSAEYTVQIAHTSGLAIGAWCPDPQSAVRLLHAGVDLVVVNDVPGTLAAVRAAQADAEHDPAPSGYPPEARGGGCSERSLHVGGRASDV